MEKIVATIPERIIELMKKNDLKQADLCRKTGLPRSAISMYLSGRRTPRQDKISQICEPFNINPAWLMGYDVPMYNSAILNDINTDYIVDCFNDKNLQFIIETYSKLPSERRLELIRFASFMAATKDDKTALETNQNKKVTL